MSSQPPPPPPPKLKLIIRRLPPTLPEAIFWKSVEPWCGPVAAEIKDGEESKEESAKVEGEKEEGVERKEDGGVKCLWRRWVQGRKVDDTNLHPIYSRAYILLPTPEAIIAFHQAFDGHTFRSKEGQEFHAVVEFAPSQKLPPSAAAALASCTAGSAEHEKKKGRGGKKVDARQGQIDEDPDFISFMESLGKPLEKPKAEDLGAANLPTPTSTPLLDHLRLLRIAKKGPLPPLAAGKKASPGEEYKRDVIYTTDGRVMAHQEGGKVKGKGMASKGAWGDEPGGSGPPPQQQQQKGKGGGGGGQVKNGVGGGGNGKGREGSQPGQARPGQGQGQGQAKLKPQQQPKPSTPTPGISLLQRTPHSGPSTPPLPGPRQPPPIQNQQRRPPQGGFQASAALLRGALNATRQGQGGAGHAGGVVGGGGGAVGPGLGEEGEKRKRVRVKKKPAGEGGSGGAAEPGDPKTARIDA